MTDSRIVRYVTEHYPQLQGFRLVPLSLVFLGAAGWRSGQFSTFLDPSWAPGLLLISVVLALVAALAINRGYRRRFGAVQPLRRASGAAAWVAGTATTIALIAIQDVVQAPFSLPLAFVGAALAYTGIGHGGVRRHYLWIAVPCLLLANAAAFGVDPNTSQVMLDLLIGGGLLVAGIGDHLVLRRVLQHPSREAYVDAAV